MVILQNTKPKITKPKVPKVKKNFNQNLSFCGKTNSILEGFERKLIIPISAKLNFLSSNEMPMKLKNYYKKRVFSVSSPPPPSPTDKIIISPPP